MAIRIFKCLHCGNVAVKMVDSGVSLVCCGEKMYELTPDTREGAGEKHMPIMRIDGNMVRVTVSSVLHPSTAEHYIQFIILETENGYHVRNLRPGDIPETLFALADSEKAVAAYAYCNLHGLWKAEVE